MICHIKNITSKQEVPTAEAQAQANVLKKKHLIQVLLGGREIPGKEFHRWGVGGGLPHV